MNITSADWLEILDYAQSSMVRDRAWFCSDQCPLDDAAAKLVELDNLSAVRRRLQAAKGAIVIEGKEHD